MAGSLADDVLTIGKDNGQMQFSIQADNIKKEFIQKYSDYQTQLISNFT